MSSQVGLEFENLSIKPFFQRYSTIQLIYISVWINVDHILILSIIISQLSPLNPALLSSPALKVQSPEILKTSRVAISEGRLHSEPQHAGVYMQGQGASRRGVLGS